MKNHHTKQISDKFKDITIGWNPDDDSLEVLPSPIQHWFEKSLNATQGSHLNIHLTNFLIS